MIVGILAGGLTAVAFGNDYQLYIIGVVALSALVGTGLNILMGLAGQISIGHAGFFAIGAYAASLLALRLNINFFVAALIGMALSGLSGALLSLPALRVRGPYLAMVTIAFGFVVEQATADWKELTGGWNGLTGLPPPALFGFTFGTRALALISVLLAVAAVPAFAGLQRSRWGLIMRATRDGEAAAQSLGANLVGVRTLAFALSAALTGLAGALFAAITGYISPDSFPFFLSITFLLVVMVGGLGHPLGPAVGAIIVVLLPESLSSLAEYRLMFFGVLLLLVLRVLPNGFMGLLRRRTAHAAPAAEGDLDAARAWIRPPTEAALEASGLTKRFGGNTALDEVAFTARAGQITSVIGPNGAGKSTLVNLVTGFHASDGGALRVGGVPVRRAAPHRIARMGVGRTFQTTQLFANLSLRENLHVAMLRGKLAGAGTPPRSAALTRGLLGLVGYLGDPDRPAGELPHVERRRVDIARALAARPRVLLLDEPAAGLSAEEKRALGNLLNELAQAGIAVLLIEHDMPLVMSLSRQIYVLDAGRLIAAGPPASVRADPQVRKAYLGDTLPGDARPGTAPPPGAGAAAPDTACLRIRELSAGYGAAPALNGISLHVARGSAVALLGPNGAGKSTLMRTIAGLHPAAGGTIHYENQPIGGMPAHRVARLGLTLIPEGRQLFSGLSVEDNIRLGASRRSKAGARLAAGVPRRPAAAELERLYELFPRLRILRRRPAGLLSGGEQQMLALARGLAAAPDVLMLDEPTIGLAPAIAQELFRALLELRRTGMTILLVDQMAYLALNLADDVRVLAGGRIVFSGSPADLHRNPELEQAYFGVDRALEEAAPD